MDATDLHQGQRRPLDTKTTRADWKYRANGQWRGQKADLWEGGHRVPFFARWPGKIKAGGTSDETICLTDVLATCAALVREKLPDDAGEDSHDFVLPASNVTVAWGQIATLGTVTYT